MDVAEGTFPLLNPGLFRHRQTPSERAIAFRPLFHGWSRMLLPGVAVGVCVMLLRLAFGLRAVGRIRRQSRPLANDGVDEMMASLLRVAPWRHPVSVRQSDQVVTAATIGCFRPLIILPADWTELDDRRVTRRAGPRGFAHMPARLSHASSRLTSWQPCTSTTR